MKKKKALKILKVLFVLFIVVFIVVPLLLELTGVYASGAWRYRLTVEVDTPEGVKTGSAVRQISNSNSIIKILDLPEAGNPASIKGEAVIVDLGARGTLFALIDDRSDEELYEAFPIKGASTAGGIRHYNWTLWPGRKAEIKENIPKMVSFTDLNDPKSVRLVFSTFRGDTKDYFQEVFGAGVKLKSVMVTITWMPVTWGVVDNYFSGGFWSTFREWMKSLSIHERSKYTHLFRLREGK